MEPAVRARLERLSMMTNPYGDTARRLSNSTEDDDPGSPPLPDRGEDTSWCACGLCVVSASAEEYVCCRDVTEIVARDAGGCITRHSYFPSICLNPGVLEATFYALQELGVRVQGELHEKYRVVAFRLFTKWIWRRLGRWDQVVLPACVVARIRQEFPSAAYVGYLHPRLED